jgi:anaerobic selenocysteine-containing dehydrogenase
LPARGISEAEFLKKLARHLNLGHIMPWNTQREFFDYLLKSLNTDCHALLKAPEGVLYSRGQNWQDFSANGAKKLNIYCAALNKYGKNPLPLPPEGKSGSKKFILTTCAKRREFIHSRHRNIPAVADIKPRIILNTAAAAAYGIKDGDIVTVTVNEHALSAAAFISSSIREDTLAAVHGWDDFNVNQFTSSALEDLDDISGFPNAVCLEAELAKQI